MSINFNNLSGKLPGDLPDEMFLRVIGKRTVDEIVAVTSVSKRVKQTIEDASSSCFEDLKAHAKPGSILEKKINAISISRPVLMFRELFRSYKDCDVGDSFQRFDVGGIQIATQVKQDKNDNALLTIFPKIIEAAELSPPSIHNADDCRSFLIENALQMKFEKLILRSLSLETLPIELKLLPLLKCLHLENNQFTVFPEILFELNLTHLYLGANKIKVIPDSIRKLNKLIALDLQNNELTTLSPSINELKLLRLLNLREHKFSSEELDNLDIPIFRVMKWMYL